MSHSLRGTNACELPEAIGESKKACGESTKAYDEIPKALVSQGSAIPGIPRGSTFLVKES